MGPVIDQGNLASQRVAAAARFVLDGYGGVPCEDTGEDAPSPTCAHRKHQ